MPKVESYGAPRVSSQVARGPQFRETQVADTGSAITRGLRDIGSSLTAMKKQSDGAAAEEALTNFEREKNDLFFNPDSGYFNSNGKNAIDGAKDANAAMIKLQQKYADSLDSSDAREAFNRGAGVHVTRGQASIQKHASRGVQDYESATIAARVENSIESAIAYYNDPDELRLQNEVGRNSVIEQADRAGLGGQAKAEMLQSYESKFAAATIDAAMRNDVNKANELMGLLGDRLEGKDAMVTETNLRKANLDADVMVKSSQVLAGGSKSLETMVNEVNEMPSGTVEQATLKSAVMKQVKSQHTLNRQVIAEQQRETYEGYGKQIQNGDMSTRDISGMVWDSMTVKQRSSLEKLEKIAASGDNIVTDDVLLANLLLLPTGELAKLDPTEYFDRVGDSDRAKLVSAVKSARKGSPTDDVKAVRTRAARTAATLIELTNKRPAKYSQEDTAKANSFYRAVDAEVASLSTSLKRDLTPSEFDDVLKGMTRTFVQEGFFYDSDRNITDVPAEYVDEIVDALQRNGVAITGDNIARAYYAAKEAGNL